MTKNVRSQNHPNRLPSELIDRFLANQSKELDIKSRESDLQKISDQHNFDYSKEALKKEAEDRKAQRIFFKEVKTRHIYFRGYSFFGCSNTFDVCAVIR